MSSKWVRAALVVDAELRATPTGRPGDRTALAELAACLVAYNAGPDGTVTPRSVWRGFESFSFRQKQRPSPFATAQLLAVLHDLDDLDHLDELAAAVDVRALASSKGGSGVALPPRPPVAGGR